jgi:cytochrome c-type biogenesis protein CcmH
MVIFMFWLAVMLLTLTALGLLLPPLLRTTVGSGADRRVVERELATLRRRLNAGEIDAATHASERERLSVALVAAVETHTPPPARWLATVLAIAVPAAALALYFGLGHPEALDQGDAVAIAGTQATPQDMDAAVGSLEERLRATPDDVAGWLLLARSYRAMQRFPDMLRATSSAFALEPANPDVMVEQAEALTLNTPTRRFEGDARKLLDDSLAADASHQKTLWLLGVAELQAERFPEAVAYWQRLRTLLASDDPVAIRVDEQIAAAQARAMGGGMPPSTAAAAAASPLPSGTANGSSASATAPAADGDAAATPGPQILVTVDIAGAIATRVAAGDTLFVFVRSPAGGPPLAIRRIDAPSFPVSITLTQADRMLEGLQIETGAEVSIGARLSKSGQAQAQAGDLQADPASLELDATNTLMLTIDSVVD